jgi:hypothetical protein
MVAVMFAFEGEPKCTPTVACSGDMFWSRLSSGIGSGMAPPSPRSSVGLLLPSFCIIFQTKDLPILLIFKILKTKEMICKIFKTLELWPLWSFGSFRETQA